MEYIFKSRARQSCIIKVDAMELKLNGFYSNGHKATIISFVLLAIDYFNYIWELHSQAKLKQINLNNQA